MTDKIDGQLHGDPAYRDGLRMIKVLEDHGYLARFAGGCVRDRLLGLKPKDYDVATDARPEQTMELFRQQRFKVVPTGVDHGTVTIVGKFAPVEVTTLRKDVATDGRRAVVAFGKSFYEDAERRDFTVNALYEDRAGQIYDYFEGQTDLQQKRLRFVGDAGQRIREDYLRILRLFRFWACLHLLPEKSTLAAVAAHKEGLAQISQERITSEFLQLLRGPAAAEALTAMHQAGVLGHWLPMREGFDAGKISQLQASGAEPCELFGLASLILQAEIPTDGEAFGQRFRLSRRQTQTLSLVLSGRRELVDEAERLTDGQLMAWIDQWDQQAGAQFVKNSLVKGWPVLFPELTPLSERLARLETRLQHRRLTPLPLSGKDVMHKLNLEGGPIIGRLMEFLTVTFRDQQWETPEEGIKVARKWLNQHHD
jgi:tRNA nucleotidyltransferase/poly(A) polymerase